VYVVLSPEKLILINMKDKNYLQILATKQQVEQHMMDRAVPLPGFDFETFPFIFVNSRDVMDVKVGELVESVDILTGMNHAFSL